MSALLRNMFARLQMPADENGEDLGGGADDRGDTLAAGAPSLEDVVAVEDPATTAEDPAAVAAAAAADAAAKAGDKDSKSIPLERHKQILDKHREREATLQQQIADLTGKKDAEQFGAKVKEADTKITALEGQYTKALADGELDKAAATMREIRQLERQITAAEVEARAEIAQAQAVEVVRYDAVVERLEAAYPVLNPASDDFDKELVAEVLELQSAFQAKGTPPSAALQKAAKYVLGADTKKQETAVSTTPRVTDEAAAAALAAQRKADATAKALAAANKTPANLNKVGIDSNKLGAEGGVKDIAKMSQDEFNQFAKNEENLAKLRGDTL